MPVTLESHSTTVMQAQVNFSEPISFVVCLEMLGDGACRPKLWGNGTNRTRVSVRYIHCGINLTAA